MRSLHHGGSDRLGPRRGQGAGPPVIRGSGVSYSDALVDINEQSIRLKNYYFPFGSRRVPFSEIIAVVVKEPTLLNGKWRRWGSGNLCTWFPPDLRRPWRDSIFIIQLASGWRRIGFTVEDSGRVRQILSEMGLVAAPCL